MTTSGTATPETCKECAPRKELRAYDADVVDYLNAAQSAFHCVAEVLHRTLSPTAKRLQPSMFGPELGTVLELYHFCTLIDLPFRMY